MGFISRAKDRIIEQVALAYLNGNLLAPYGRALDFRIDTTEKTITIHVELKGETEPLEIDITDYEISQRHDHYFATIKGIHTSREWLTTLANDRLDDLQFKLPPNVGKLLMRAL